MNQITTTDKPQQYIEVRRNDEFRMYMFVDCNSDSSNIWIYYKGIESLHFDYIQSPYFVNMQKLCTDIHITTDQWNRFLKTLRLLAAPIRSLAEQLNIDMTKTFLFRLNEDNPDKCIKGVLYPSIPYLEIRYDYFRLSDTYETVPYDPQLDEYISRFMSELRETMNQWLHLA